MNKTSEKLKTLKNFNRYFLKLISVFLEKKIQFDTKNEKLQTFLFILS